MIVILIGNPQIAYHIGFQFSFLATASILIFYNPINIALQSILPKRSLSDITTMNTLNQHGYILSCFIPSIYSFNDKCKSFYNTFDALLFS